MDRSYLVLSAYCFGFGPCRAYYGSDPNARQAPSPVSASPAAVFIPSILFSCLCLSRLCTFSTCTMLKRKRCSTDSEGLPLVRRCIQSPAAFSSYPSPETAEGRPSKRAKSEPKSVVSKARFTIYAWGAYQLTCSFRTLRSMPIALKVPPN